MKEKTEIQARLAHSCLRVRRRLQFQRALDWLVTFWTLGVVLLAVVALATALRWVESTVLNGLTTFVFGGALLAFVGGCMRGIDDIDAAWRLDRASQLQERLSSAVAFLRLPQPTSLHLAAIQDAHRVLHRADPISAAPWRLPRHWQGGLFGTALFVGVCLVHFPVAPTEAHGLRTLSLSEKEPFETVKITPAERERLDDDMATLDQQVSDSSDPEIKAWLAELNRLLKAMQEGKISLQKAHGQIARLEAARKSWLKRMGSEDAQVPKRLQSAAEKVNRPHRAVTATLEALRQKRWDEASKALRALSDNVDSQTRKQRERRAIGRSLDRFAKGLESKTQRQRTRLKAERDRLRTKEKKKGDRFSRRDRNRLKKKERELERLERQAAEMGEMRRQLERLQRTMNQAAQDLMRRDKTSGRTTAESLKRAADILRRLSQGKQGAEQLKQAERRLVDLKELLRRAGKRSRGGRSGAGDKEERFLVLANGKKGQAGYSGSRGNAQRGTAKKGDERGFSVGMGEKVQGAKLEAGSNMTGENERPDSASSKGADAGDGYGHGHDPNIFGEGTQNAVNTVDEQVQGQQGEGKSVSKVVQTAATKGFASGGWKRVHQDYRKVVEEDLDRQEIPAGQRRYVRRYFELIGPH